VERGGVHLLCSMEPIPQLTPEQLVSRMPASAQRDLTEWVEGTEAVSYMQKVINGELQTDALLNPDTEARVTDDRPYNEYFMLRWLRRVLSR
jgi:hypothetical protein